MTDGNRSGGFEKGSVSVFAAVELTLPKDEEFQDIKYIHEKPPAAAEIVELLRKRVMAHVSES